MPKLGGVSIFGEHHPEHPDPYNVPATGQFTGAITAPPQQRSDFASKTRKNPSQRLPLQLLLIVALMLLGLGAIIVGSIFTYQKLYSPGAFVSNYARMLSDGHTAEALQLPGVSVSSQRNSTPFPASISDALLRSSATASLSDIEVVSQQQQPNGTYLVKISYLADGVAGESVFSVVQQGWIGVVPNWSFARSPLAMLDLTVEGSLLFDVNGFELDARQLVSDPDSYVPGKKLAMLVFAPGAYNVSVDTNISSAPNQKLLAQEPGAAISTNLSATPTDQFKEQVKESLDSFLNDCAAQEVLQPSGCPFGYHIRNRVETPPQWTITEFPQLELNSAGGFWHIKSADAQARLQLQIRMIEDGSLVDVDEQVPFTVSGRVVLGPDGNPVVRVSGSNKDNG